jgi:hypothetical protein
MKVSGGVTFTSNIYAPNIVTSINGATGDITGLSASTVMLGSTNSNFTRYLVFAATAGDQSLLIDNITTPLSYNPFAGTIGAKIFNATGVGANQVKLDGTLPSLFATDGSDTNTFGPYSFAHSGPKSLIFISGSPSPGHLFIGGVRFSDGDPDEEYATSTWGYTFPAAQGNSGQAIFTNGNGQLYWSNAVSTFNGATGEIVGVSSVNGQTGAVKVGRSLSVYAPTTSDNITMFYTTNALTLTNIESVLRGSAGPGVTFSVRYGTDRSAAGTEVVTSGIKCTNTTNGLSTTSFNNGTITGSSFVWLTVSGVSGTVNELSVTLEF